MFAVSIRESFREEQFSREKTGRGILKAESHTGQSTKSGHRWEGIEGFEGGESRAEAREKDKVPMLLSSLAGKKCLGRKNLRVSSDQTTGRQFVAVGRR